MTATIKSFIPDLPPKVWRILAGDALSALGSGLVLPFLVVYLRDVRGIDVTTAGFVFSSLALVALIFGAPSGVVVDRYGPRRALIGALVLCGIGSIGFALISEPWHAFVSAMIFGTGIAAMWPATHSLLSSVVSESKRSSVFAVHYATLNAGIGVGGIIGGLVVDVNRPGTFEAMYLLDALTWVIFGVMLFVMKDIGNAPPKSDELKANGGYRTVVADKIFMRLMIIAAVMVTVGYSQLESGFPAFITSVGNASTRLLGATFAANTFVIVVAQLVLLKWLEGKRRTRALMSIFALWATAWTLVLIAVRVPEGLLRSGGFILAMAVFALGECLVSPTVPGMTNDLAPDELRGRYNAGYSLTFSIGHIIGPALAGLMLGQELGEPFFVGLVLVCIVCIPWVRTLERRVPERANLIRSDEEPVAPTEEESLVTS